MNQAATNTKDKRNHARLTVKPVLEQIKSFMLSGIHPEILSSDLTLVLTEFHSNLYNSSHLKRKLRKSLRRTYRTTEQLNYNVYNSIVPRNFSRRRYSVKCLPDTNSQVYQRIIIVHHPVIL